MVAYAPNVNIEAALSELCVIIEYGVIFRSVGGLFSSGTTPERLNALAMAGSRRISLGLIPMPGSLIVLSM